MGEAVAMTRSACASSLIIVAQTVDALRSFSIAGRSTAPIVVVAATVCRLKNLPTQPSVSEFN